MIPFRSALVVTCALTAAGCSDGTTSPNVEAYRLRLPPLALEPPGASSGNCARPQTGRGLRV